MPMRRAARSPGVRPAPGDAANDIDALIVGAGPTGLALAARLLEFGASFRIIDRLTDRTRESRALAVQARTLEQLQAIGLGERLAAAGNASTRLRIHFEGGVVGAELGGFRAPDTRFPFILFISQAETEALLGEHLAAHGVVVERGVELTRFHVDDAGVACTLRRADGGTERVRAAYLAGCDGAHSTVRKAAGIAFEGGTYLQDFMLGDVDADGPLEAHTIHSFPGGRGVAMFFPLGAPRAWRVIAMAPGGVPAAPDAATTGELTLGEIQSVVDAATGGRVRLR
ncbi:MAG TPA: FAD-dependent monooxygenase, partial [Longimicrobiales bacterium]